MQDVPPRTPDDHRRTVRAPAEAAGAVVLPRTRDAEVVLLDGGTATTLEAAGHDLHDALWSARLLLDDPEAIVAVHRAFLAAGADVVTTASYQLAARSLRAAGRDGAQLDRLLGRAVAIGREAVAAHLDVAADGEVPARGHTPRRPRPLVAASVGPFGAALADGSEYRGGYGLRVDELVDFHGPRIELLARAGADVLACETIPSATELAALARVLAVCDVPAYVSVTLGPDGTTTAEGQPLLDAFGPLLDARPDHVVAIGVNCCAPELVGPALAALAGVGRPLVVKPNAGGRWDVEARRWTPRTANGTSPATTGRRDGSDARAWMAAGARLIGGCCGTTPADLARLRDELHAAGAARS